jgi:hypothetical protein
MDHEHQEYLKLISTPRRGRILEEPSGLLSNFVADHKLAIPKMAFYRPLSFCEPKRCFVNVDTQVAKMGGSILTGWIFWEIENTVLHTEAHAIWVATGGSWIDITPHRLPPRRVMFSPDPNVSEKRGYTTGYETSLTNDPKVIALHRFGRSLSLIWERNFKGMGHEMEISTTEVKNVAREAGLPESVAKYLFEKKLEQEQRMVAKYAAKP